MKLHSREQHLTHFTLRSQPHLVQVAQVILSETDCSVTIFPEGTSCTCRV